jgi:hypothetical protein
VTPTEQTMDSGFEVRPNRLWVRIGLILIAVVLGVVFYVATQVQPYNPDGTAMRAASHQTIGLPPCRFKEWTGTGCPSCGMTTSFALLVRGDLVNSMRANWVGTSLAIFCAAVIPWAIISAFRGKYLWVQRVDAMLALSVGVLTVAMLLRWGTILLLSLFE